MKRCREDEDAEQVMKDEWKRDKSGTGKNVEREKKKMRRLGSVGKMDRIRVKE